MSTTARPQGPVIVAVTSSGDAIRYVTTALRHRAALVHATTSSEAVALSTRLRPNAVLVELTEDADDEGSAAITRLRAELPAVLVVAYCWLTPATARQIVRAARAGVGALALRGYDDVGRMIDAVLEESVDGAIAAEVVSQIGRVPRQVRGAVEYCVRHARSPLSVDELAAGVGVPRRTLHRCLLRAAVPAPSALISWGRLFVAAKCMEDPERSVDDIALSLGYASGSALRGMLKRYTTLRPDHVRRGGGLVAVTRAFRDRHVPQEATAP